MATNFPTGLDTLVNPASTDRMSVVGHASQHANGMGANSLIQRVQVNQTYGAFPNPGTLWDTVNATTGGSQHFVVFRW